MADDRCAFHYDYPPPHKDLDSGCQFTDETKLFPCGSAHYCRFHLPLHDEQGEPTVKADWQDPDRDRGRAFNKAVAELIGNSQAENVVLDLSGVVFPSDIAFGEGMIPASLWYGVRFSGRAGFTKATLQGDATFRDAEFQGDALFEDAEFQGDVLFEDAKFQGDAYFQNAEFQRGTLFRDAEFQGDAYFAGAEFQGGAVFRDAEFRGYAYFENAEFRGDAYFQDAEFQREAYFEDAEFQVDADFQDSEFQRGAVFQNTEFQGASYFWDTEFQDTADFQDAEFHGAADFQDAEFRGDANFSFSDRPATPQRQATVEGSDPSNRPAREPAATAESDRGAFQALRFTDGVLGGRANFSNRRFKQVTDFSGCRFGLAPKFHNATLHQDTNWQAAEFKERKGDDAERAYRTLRLAMETNRDRPQEAVFFALEQQATRSLRPWWHANRWLSYAYQVTSSYGRSAVLPLLWLGGSLIAFFLIYWALDGWQSGRGEALITFTAQQAVKPFAVWGRVATDLSPLFSYEPATGAVIPLGFKLWATLQSVLNLAFVALFILALRWLFKRG